jgi:hypothetical protein
MTVCVTKHDDIYGHARDGIQRKPGVCCTFCGGELFYPFLRWDTYFPEEKGHGHIFLCSNCCSETERELIADLIHLEAAIELGRLYQRREVTFIRESIQRLEERGR